MWMILKIISYELDLNNILELKTILHTELLKTRQHQNYFESW